MSADPQTPRKQSIRVRIVRPHRHGPKSCARRAKKADWSSAWWLTGDHEWLTQTGRRANKNCHAIWLKASCLFTDCKAEAWINAIDLGDYLTKKGLLPR